MKKYKNVDDPFLFREDDVEELPEAGELAPQVHHGRHRGGNQTQLSTALQQVQYY